VGGIALNLPSVKKYVSSDIRLIRMEVLFYNVKWRKYRVQVDFLSADKKDYFILVYQEYIKKAYTYISNRLFYI
jgi:hypothetical protein